MSNHEGDQLGNRMKMYERMGGTEDRLMPLIPVVCRIDGNNFSKFTKGLQRPYDERLSRLMRATTQFLVEFSNARMGYTQSDEITLAWYSDDIKSQIFFDGRRDKMNTILASRATAFFNRNLGAYLPEKEEMVQEKPEKAPVFDCRVWNVPNKTEGANVFVWREQDATKNSISMAAQHYFSHKRLQGLNGKQMQELLFQEAKPRINWNDYPAFFKRGTYIRRETISRPFSADEIDKLPPKHAARTNPKLVVERQQVREIEMPIFVTLANREEVIFDGANPEVYTIYTTGEAREVEEAMGLTQPIDVKNND